MRFGDWPSRLNRVQHGLTFKVVASIIVTALCVAYASWQAVAAADRAVVSTEEQIRAQVGDVDLDEELRRLEADPEQTAQAENLRGFIAQMRGMDEILARSENWTVHVAGAGIVLALALAVIWLGLGLMALGLWLGLTVVVAPMWIIGSSLPATAKLGETLKGGAFFLYALGALTFAFSVLMTLLRLGLSGPGRVLAIARNVAMEAVRLKVSLVFIVLLIFALASLPGLLNEDTPLRYRMQAFLQYGVGGTFWIIAILTVFLAVGTVAFEQRDRIIWQTATKPVAPWQYLLGKWLGVVCVSAVMLAVAGSGVFLFTEYLRMQPAVGEVAAFVPADRNNPGMTEDRRVLETQVLSARRLVQPEIAPVDRRALDEYIERKVAEAKRANPAYADTREARSEIVQQFTQEWMANQRQIPYSPDPLATEFIFRGLETARNQGRSLTFRYQANVGSNDPRTVYRIAIQFGDFEPVFRQIAVGQALNEQVPPMAVYPDGVLRVLFANLGDADQTTPSESISFPPEGLQVFYAVGSYRFNYGRIFVLLWLKLAFLAMIGVTCSTFLAFSVASLVSFGTFLVAESSGYLFASLQYYSATEKGEIIIHRVVVKALSEPIAIAFQFYSNLRPTANLVEGRLVSITSVLQAGLLFGGLCLVLYVIGVLIYRKRELATYSGQ